MLVHNGAFDPKIFRDMIIDAVEFDALENDLSSAVEKTELDRYLEEKRLNHAIDIDVLEYWGTNCARFPNLALMAKDVLSIPISTVASESAFSVGGKVLDQYRSCLAHNIVESLICIHDWKFNQEVPEELRHAAESRIQDCGADFKKETGNGEDPQSSVPSSHISKLKMEFSKKKQKGKLPKEARDTLLDWWKVHNKWPYPTEADKIFLAEATGLDQKQINNWFINQRKRHWKPSEDMQLAVMDSISGQFYATDD
ncbi:hypothetical protein AgCh_001966 [Apium graveolens]